MARRVETQRIRTATLRTSSRRFARKMGSRGSREGGLSAGGMDGDVRGLHAHPFHLVNHSCAPQGRDACNRQLHAAKRLFFPWKLI